VEGFLTPVQDSSRPAGVHASLQAVVSQLRGHIEAPVLPLPEVQRGRRKRLFVPEEERRRSQCIARKAQGKPASYLKKAQIVLMTRLGICDVEGEPPVDCLAKYAKLFEEPLPSSRIEALTKLFFLETAELPGDWAS
jgi:hypothetical protein